MIRAGLLEAAWSASALILAVLALRRLCRGRVSARVQYALWLVVLLRLLIPLPLPKSRFSAAGAANRLAVQSAALFPARQAEETPLSRPEVLPDLPAGSPEASVTPAPPPVPGGSEGEPRAIALPLYALPWLLWAVGSGAVLTVFLRENLALALYLRKTRAPFDPGTSCALPVYTAPGLPSPCLFGPLRPAVYLTPQEAADPAALPYILAHEETHFRHGDHLWPLLRALAAALHWWNPLVWLAARQARADCELACDEGALRRLGPGCRLNYGRTLVRLAAARPSPRALLQSATTMSGTKKELKQRLALILHSPKTAVPVLVCALAALALAAVCTFTGARTSLSQELERAVHSNILAHALAGREEPLLFGPDGQPIGLDGENGTRIYAAEDHEVLAQSEQDGLVRVLVMVLYGEYRREAGELVISYGFHTPTVLTFRQLETGYDLTDYWEPRDGALYPQDLREMRASWFPRVTQSELNTQRCIRQQERRLEAQVRESAQADAQRQAELDRIEERLRARFREQDWPEAEQLVWNELRSVAAEAVLDFQELGLQPDAEAAVQAARAYYGSELARERGWDLEAFAQRLAVLRAEYYVEYDTQKTFVPSGFQTALCWLMQNPQDGSWQIVPEMTSWDWLAPEAALEREDGLRENEPELRG